MKAKYIGEGEYIYILNSDREGIYSGIDIEGRIERDNIMPISDEEAIENYIRHELTDYDEIIKEIGKEKARAKIEATVNAVKEFWKGKSLAEFSKKDIKRLKDAFAVDTIQELNLERKPIGSDK